MTEFFNRLNPKPQYNKEDYLIYNLKEMNMQNIEQAKKGRDLPNFNYKRDDANLNLTPQIVPSIQYKNKSMFNSFRPLQTEQDEEGLAIGFLDNYYGRKEYSKYLISSENLPKDNNLRRTPKRNLFELK